MTQQQFANRLRRMELALEVQAEWPGLSDEGCLRVAIHRYMDEHRKAWSRKSRTASYERIDWPFNNPENLHPFEAASG